MITILPELEIETNGSFCYKCPFKIEFQSINFSSFSCYIFPGIISLEAEYINQKSFVFRCDQCIQAEQNYKSYNDLLKAYRTLINKQE